MFDSPARLRFAALSLGALFTLLGCGSPAGGASDAAPAREPAGTEEAAHAETAGQEPLLQTSGHELVLPAPVVFETASDVLHSESDAVLAEVKRYLDAKADITLLRIEGHTDSEGDPQENQKLSERRALSVARWLVAKGIDCRRLLPVGFGGDKPVAPNDMPQGRAANRRISFVNAALRGRPIGGMPVDGSGTIAGDPCH